MSLPCAVLFCGDPYVTDKAFQAFHASLKKEKKEDPYLLTFELPSTPFETVLAEARNLPFLAACQLLRIRGAEELGDEELALLETYLKNPVASTYLTFETTTGKCADLQKLIAKSGKVELFETAASDRRSAAAKLIKDKLAGSGKTIEPEALALLEDQYGEALAFLDSVLGQLILYCQDKKVIDAQTVDLFYENWKQLDAFSLVEAIGQRKAGRALEIIRQLLEDNDRDQIQVLGVLHWQMRRLWQAKVLLEQGMPEAMILKKCRISFKQAPYFMREARGFSLSRIEAAIEGLFQLDLRLKTGQTDGVAGLESWVVRLTAA